MDPQADKRSLAGTASLWFSLTDSRPPFGCGLAAPRVSLNAGLTVSGPRRGWCSPTLRCFCFGMWVCGFVGSRRFRGTVPVHCISIVAALGRVFTGKELLSIVNIAMLADNTQ